MIPDQGVIDIQEIVMVEETEIPLVAEIEMVDSESEMVKAEVVEVVKAEAEVAEVVKGTNTITGSGIQEWIGLGNLIIVIHADVGMEHSTIMIIDEMIIMIIQIVVITTTGNPNHIINITNDANTVVIITIMIADTIKINQGGGLRCLRRS